MPSISSDDTLVFAGIRSTCFWWYVIAEWSAMRPTLPGLCVCVLCVWGGFVIQYSKEVEKGASHFQTLKSSNSMKVCSFSIWCHHSCWRLEWYWSSCLIGAVSSDTAAAEAGKLLTGSISCCSCRVAAGLKLRTPMLLLMSLRLM